MRIVLPALFLLAGCGTGLDPYNLGVPDDEREVTTGVDMMGNSYLVDLLATRVMEPVALDRMFQQSSRSHVILNVPEQGASAFKLVASLAATGGGQDVCAPMHDLGIGGWDDDTNLRVEGGAFVVPIAGNSVDFTDIMLVSSVNQDTEIWYDTLLTAEVDTRQMRGGAFPKGTEPCDLIEAEGGECHACDIDGVLVCTEVRMALETSLSDEDFDADPDTSGC